MHNEQNIKILTKKKKKKRAAMKKLNKLQEN